MRTFPLIHQPDSMDCGPACLGMISKYYGKEYSLDGIRQKSYIGRDGVSLLGISRAAEKMGFRTVGGRITFDKLAEKALLPCIVHWRQEHFVVVYKIAPSNSPKRGGLFPPFGGTRGLRCLCSRPGQRSYAFQP